MVQKVTQIVIILIVLLVCVSWMSYSIGVGVTKSQSESWERAAVYGYEHCQLLDNVVDPVWLNKINSSEINQIN
jgi:hypothetical protein